MSGPLPRPPSTALLSQVDTHIKTLAYAVDNRLGFATRLQVTLGEFTTESDGSFTVPFPGLGAVVGAVVFPAGVHYLNGAVNTYPPVPPSNIGDVLRVGSAWVGLSTVGAGSIRCRAYQPPSDIGPKNGYPRQYSAQPASGGQKLKVAAVAWAAVVGQAQ